VTPIPILIIKANLPLMMIDMWTVSTFYARHQLFYYMEKRGGGEEHIHGDGNSPYSSDLLVPSESAVEDSDATRDDGCDEAPIEVPPMCVEEGHWLILGSRLLMMIVSLMSLWRMFLESEGYGSC
jgi:hypothetical protein